MNMGQDRQIQNVGGNGGNQFGQYAGQVTQNQQGYNACQNGGIQVAQNAGVQSGLRVWEMAIKPDATTAEDWFILQGDLDEIDKVNANCILMANLQKASTSGTQHDKAPVYDTDGSAEIIAKAIVLLHSFHAVVLALRHYKMMTSLDKQLTPPSSLNLSSLLIDALVMMAFFLSTRACSCASPLTFITLAVAQNCSMHKV
nr:hypothetical protein [Tanacetum cinerariifolium]